ncbi:MAG: DUF362 domain-containing protein [Desulfobacteraceae bacterium]|jgi:uncharacterized protein (DUF362 family)/NAD-dependent dihydropyrimidine dehydrogenase PreA subunit|nr:DUF362 domain-containing protein [Desulfobacteraceae bacterium]
MHQVLIHPASYDDCAAAVAEAFARFAPEIAGRRILVKPNLLRASAAEDGIVTHPAVLAAVIRELEARHPAEIVVGDNPGLYSYGANEAAFAQTGLGQAAGACYRNIGTEGVTVPLKTSGFDGTVSVSRAVMAADVVISLPKFKTHGLTVITGAIKNSYGILPGAQKARLHLLAGSPARFNETIVDVFKLRVPDFFIMDAVVGMEGNGPASTELRSIGCLLASDNAVAMDAVMARMMGLDPGRLRFLQRAAADGLGRFEVDAIEIIGEMPVLPDFKVPPLGGEALAGNTAVQEMLAGRVGLRPRPDAQRCTGCGTCVDQCPAGALTLVDDLPQVTPELCIACFCCQEMCPEQAMVLV